jgi:hypothetical protein
VDGPQDEQNPSDAVHHATKLADEGLALCEQRRAADAIRKYDEIDALYGRATELGLRVHVARALVNKASHLSESGRAEECIRLLDGEPRSSPVRI